MRRVLRSPIGALAALILTIALLFLLNPYLIAAVGGGAASYLKDPLILLTSAIAAIFVRRWYIALFVGAVIGLAWTSAIPLWRSPDFGPWTVVEFQRALPSAILAATLVVCLVASIAWAADPRSRSK